MFCFFRPLLPLLPLLCVLVGRAQPCNPPNFCGIVTGITLDRDVVALHGPGLFSDDLGHVGGRYYTDTTMSVTMIVSTGTDNYIEEVELRQGLAFPKDAPKDLKPFVSRRLWRHDNGRLFRNGLGATREEIKTAYGAPTEANDERSYWSYASDPVGCLAFVATTFVFTDDKVTSISFYNGD
ncbi:MAG: hypothetical protein WAU70_09330 [Flavobacteriales bacterium]